MERGRLGDIAGAVVISFVLHFVYTKFAGPIPFTVNNINTNKTDFFSTTGSGEATAVPDTALLN